ncbi:Ig-like domain-containing protein [Paenibacillus sp. 1P07SE]|uniref:Ig-like domain-containing protein n=1 Tax=Paenibacillus sp. 1P07SE TaxID=3132209 RepID=UPI0039A44708
MTTTDPDAGDEHEYSLVYGTGDTDNSRFSIVGNQLRAVLAAEIPAGTYSVRIRTTDQLGETFEKPFTVTVIDDVAPNAPVITTPLNGSYTSETPTISGTAEAGSTVLISIDGAAQVNATVNGSGFWSHTPVSQLSQGPHAVSATARDAAGNVSIPSATVNFIVDTVPPATPVITSPADGTTVTEKRPVITGTTEAGSTVMVSVGGASEAATVQPNGSWSYTPTADLDEGPHTVSVTATDAAGNESTPPATASFTVDTIPPAAPTILAPANGTVTSDATPTVTISADSDAVKVTVLLNEIEVGDAEFVAGEWTYTPSALTDGTYEVTAVAADAAGNTSEPSQPVSFTVDTETPEAPVITYPASGGYTTASPTITGTAEPDSTVLISIDGAAPASATVNGSGDWSYTPASPLSQGPHSVSATARDEAGNESIPSTTVNFTVDTEPPATPVITSPAAGTTVTEKRPVITGMTEVGSTVRVTVGGASGAASVQQDGNWSYTPTADLSEGPHTVSVTATDAAGNESTPPATASFTVDTIPPGVPTILAPANGTVTSDATPTITLTADADAVKVTVFLNGSEAGEATLEAGEWSYTLSALTDGTYEATATASDLHGNTSESSQPVSFTVDTESPEAPVITYPASGGYTTAEPTITGTAEPDSTVLISIDGAAPVSATVNGTGMWSYAPTTALDEGSHTVSAIARDAAGNESIPSTTVNFTVDTIPPAAPVITAPEDGSTVTEKRPVITGMTEIGSTVMVTVGGASGAASVQQDGSWSYTPTADLSEGPHTVSVTATDAAGNESTPPATASFTVDTIPPAAPTILAPANGTVTSDATPTVTISADADADSVTVFINGTALGEATQVAGEWSYTPSALTDGPYEVTVVAADAAGNTSEPSQPVSFTVDTEAPEAPVITYPANGGYTTASPTITGTAEPDSTVLISIDGAAPVNATVNGSGHWSYTPTTALSQGAHSVSAIARDAAGNESVPSTTVNFTVDTEAPDSPTILSPANGSTVTVKRPVITGTTEVGSTVIVTIGAHSGEADVENDGSWSYTPTADLSEGPHTVSATATDAAGNESAAPAMSTFTVDTIPPVLTLIGEPEVELLLGDSYTDPGATAEDALDGDLTDEITVNGSVDTSIPGIYIISYDVVDQAGNAATAIQRTVTVLPPAVTVTGGVNLVRVTDALPGAVLTLYNAIGEVVGETAAASAQGTYTFNSVTAGSGYTVTQTVNGARSAASTAVQVTQRVNEQPIYPGNPWPSPVTPGNVRVVDVALGDSTEAAERVEIARTVDAAGKKVDAVVFDTAKAASVVAKAQAQGQSKAIILIDDLPGDPADEVTTSLPASSLKLLADNDISLELRTEGARIELPLSTLTAMQEAGLRDLFFRIVPVRGEERQTVVTRTVTSEQVEEAAGGGRAQVLGTPMVIETNYTAFATKMIFPLPQLELPQQSAALQRLIDSLAVYIEHSDGEKKLQRGVIVYDANGVPEGIEIEIDKFSTFSIVSITDDEAHMAYIKGYPDGRFGPERIVTRAELAAMLSRLLGDQVQARPATDYSDLSDAHWAAAYIADMQALGLMQGYPDGSFRPDQTIRRAELATVASRLLPAEAPSAAALAPDASRHWASDAIRRAAAAGLMSGYADGLFRPDQGLTRAEAVTVLNRAFGRTPLQGADNPYSDVTASHWAYGDILEASIAHTADEHR